MSLALIVVMTTTLWIAMVTTLVVTFYVLHQRTNAIVQRLDVLVREADQMNQWMVSKPAPLSNFRHRNSSLALSQAPSYTAALSQQAELVGETRVIDFLPRSKS